MNHLWLIFRKKKVSNQNSKNTVSNQNSLNVIYIFIYKLSLLSIYIKSLMELKPHLIDNENVRVFIAHARG